MKLQARFLKNLESDYNLFRNNYDINGDFNNVQRTDRRDSIYGSQDWNESPIASELVKLNKLSSVYQDGSVIAHGLERLDSFFKDKERHNRFILILIVKIKYKSEVIILKKKEIIIFKKVWHIKREKRIFFTYILIF